MYICICNTDKSEQQTKLHLDGKSILKCKSAQRNRMLQYRIMNLEILLGTFEKENVTDFFVFIIIVQLRRFSTLYENFLIFLSSVSSIWVPKAVQRIFFQELL
jgi:hypothetical protein